MKTVLKGLMAAGITAACLASPAAAQQKSWGFGFHGSYFKSGTLAKSSTDTELQLDNKSSLGGNLEAWFGGGRLGLRADASHTNTPWILEAGSTSTSISNAQATLATYGKVDLWMADADLMLRLFTPTVDRRFAPFVSLGGGIVRWDVNNPNTGAFDLRVPEADVQIYGSAQSEPAVTGSIGTDFFLAPAVALRLEAKDYWNPSSPYIRLSELTNTDGSTRHHNGAHNMLYSAGLTFLFGGHKEEPGFIAVAPEPEPAPVVVVQAPAPPPAPTTEAVNMCYVDQSGRLQTVSAVRNLSNSNIYVNRNGSNVLFTTAYPTSEPYYIKGSSWYMASRPLMLDLGKGTAITTDVDVNTVPNRIEWVNFGSSQPIAASDLTFVGSINGTPLYARSSDIGGFQSDLDAAMRTSSDLSRMLSDQAFADRYVNEIGTFYMPVEPGTDCVFQPVSSTHVVRRTRG